MSSTVEEVRRLQQKLHYCRWKIRKFEVYWSEQKLKGTKNTVVYAEKSIKAYEELADECLRRIGDLIG